MNIEEASKREHAFNKEIAKECSARIVELDNLIVKHERLVEKFKSERLYLEQALDIFVR